MAGRDTLDLEILGGVAGEFENFGSQVLEDGGDIDSGYNRTSQRRVPAGKLTSDHTFGTNSHLVLGVVLEETLDTAAGELENFDISCCLFVDNGD
jgi:hypothetical protein